MIKIALLLLMIYLFAFLGFWLGGLFYAAIVRRPSVYFPARLAATMAAAGLAGSLLVGIGGVVLATVVMDRAFARRDDYDRVAVRVAGAVLSTLALAGTFLASYRLVGSVFGQGSAV
ncbi:hypothetical protein HFP89_10660 [Wenzhouxiangella sp. XN79A]|uniref:hypothetical protein n=1 Tax=Wenzhouxiangella sp. XN79A TaxID=2724193 RepID=UPI00144AF30E|nr:hypothetical protein [Wenzhouxiangella sp. XN79A]NKI35625.1 hypothetical protein [Wenzhouxiangella sp. XN79A]